MIQIATIYLAVFGVLTIIGGVVGFVKAKSRASLIAGGVSGVVLLLAAYLTNGMGKPGLIVGLVVSLGLAGRFVPKVRASGVAKLMSALALIGVGVTVAALVRP